MIMDMSIIYVFKLYVGTAVLEKDKKQINYQHVIKCIARPVEYYVVGFTLNISGLNV